MKILYEITGGAYDGREGIKVEKINNDEIKISFYYDGGCDGEIWLIIPIKELEDRLKEKE